MHFDALADVGGARAQVAPFARRLLHAVFAEGELAALRYRRPDLVGGESFGDGDELDRGGVAAKVARPERDGGAQGRQPFDDGTRFDRCLPGHARSRA